MGERNESTVVPPCVYVCEGKDCRNDGGAKLRRQLETDGLGVVGVECLGVCSGPVAATSIAGDLQVWHKLKGRKRRDLIADSIRMGDAAALAPLEPKKPKQKKAVRRVEHQMAASAAQNR